MIQTTLQELTRFPTVHPRFQKAFAALQQLAAEPFVKGRHDIDGEQIFINAAEYDTKAPGDLLYEAHRKYIDVMLLLSGEEQIHVLPVSKLTNITAPYDDAGDALLAKEKQLSSVIQMEPGTVAILFPEDAHAPGMMTHQSCRVRKLIAKVMIESHK